MSTTGIMNQYPFISAMTQPYPLTNQNLFQFPPNAQQITIPYDLASQIISPIAFNYVGDLDSMVNSGEKFMTENCLSIRILMSGKEVGSIIGKRGDNIKKFREDSMARINISDGNSPERIVTISGSCDQIRHAVLLMSKKLEDDALKSTDKLSEPSAAVLSIRLLIQPIQYSSLIGNGGSTMAQLKEITDATILFGIDFLPNSSERLLNISGSSEAVANCILELCRILLETPSNNYVVPYSPKPMSYPTIPQTIVTNGTTKMTSPMYGESIQGPATSLPLLPLQSIYPQSLYSDALSYPMGLPMSLIPLNIPNPLATYLNKTPCDSTWKPSSNPTQLPPQQNVSREFFVENEMIGCIIGRGGSTINEIRAISGAQIKISNCEDGKQERRINICGTFDAVQTAQLLINSSLEIYKQTVKIKAATNSNTAPIIFSNPLLPPVIPQNIFHAAAITQSPFFAFNSPMRQDYHNISIMNSASAQTFDSPLTPKLPGPFENGSFDRLVTKMKSTQVHLDGSRNVTVMKFKPY